MSKEKQIEKMAQDVCGYCNIYGVCILDDKKCDLKCSHRDVAEEFYNAGYRKQSEGEWKIMKMGDGKRVRTCSSCLISQSVNVYKGKVMFMYCPYCGAKMKGGE